MRKVCILLIAVLMTVTSAFAAEKSIGYVSAEWLKENIDKVVVIDVRDKGYDGLLGGHIPGALNAPWKTWTDVRGRKQGERGWNTPKDLPDMEKHIRSLGIDGTKPIVVYGDPKAPGAEGRVALELLTVGCENIFVLNGGIGAWEKAKGAMTKDVPQVTTSNFKAKENAVPEWLIDTDTLAASRGELVILDSRAADMYTGQRSGGEPRAGHIAGAISVPLELALNKDGMLLSKEEIQSMMESKGIKKSDRIVTYCTIGNRGGMLAGILRYAGYDARSYVASFSEWAGQENLPVEK